MIHKDHIDHYDQSRGRVKLAKELFEAADKLAETEKAIGRAWDICEPYM